MNSNFLDSLKEQTSLVHKAAHKVEYFKVLMKKNFPLKSYIEQLRTLSIVLAALERELLKTLPEFSLFIENGHKKLLWR